MMSQAMEQVLAAMFTELRKDVPNLEENVTAASLGMDRHTFRVAVWRLQTEGYIDGVRSIPHGNSDYPLRVLIGGAFLTDKGQRHVGGSESVPGPVVYQGPVTFHNITVTSSSIGIMNTGNIGNIDAVIDVLARENQRELADAIESFTESVLAEASLASSAREEIIEYLSYLSSQLVIPKETRAKSLPRVSLDSIAKLVSAATGLVTLWDKVYPVLKAALGA